MSNASTAATTLRADFFGSRQFSGRMVRRDAIRTAVQAGVTVEQAAEITGLDLGYVRSLFPTAAAEARLAAARRNLEAAKLAERRTRALQRAAVQAVRPATKARRAEEMAAAKAITEAARVEYVRADEALSAADLRAAR